MDWLYWHSPWVVGVLAVAHNAAQTWNAVIAHDEPALLVFNVVGLLGIACAVSLHRALQWTSKNPPTTPSKGSES